MNIISIDLPWQEEKKGGRAIAIADLDGNVKIAHANDDTELIKLVTQSAEPRSMVLLDIPIEGCQNLKNVKGRRFRPVDLALAHQGIGLFPSYKAENRGKELKEQLAKENKDVIVQEIYPYAIYKFLAYLDKRGKLERLKANKFERLLDEDFRVEWPRKYKRERNPNKRRENMAYLYSLLTEPSLGLHFSPPLRYPETSDTLSGLTKLSDEYDACLGVVAGWYFAQNSHYAGIAGDAKSGNILVLADRWLATQLEKEVKMTKPEVLFGFGCIQHRVSLRGGFSPRGNL